jgi:hypothetical protein
LFVLFVLFSFVLRQTSKNHNTEIL